MLYITLFVVLPFKELIGLIWALAEPVIILVPNVAVGISYVFQTKGIVPKSCRTLFTLIFNWTHFLVPLLLCVGGLK